MKILIAEDDVTTRKTLEALLVRWEYDVVSVSDGQEALRILQAEDGPRLAVLDWMMPGLDGLEVLRRVRADSPERKRYRYIILLTSKKSIDEIVAGLETGADDYMVKPFNPNELISRIRAGRRIIELQDELVAAQESLRYQATHDPLTGILNRRAVFARLEEEVSRAQRLKSPLAVALIDLDHFKRVNDAYGHQAGDETLQECARRINGAVRKYDSVGRYGGEEFLVVIPGSPGWDIGGAAGRIHSAIGNQDIALPAGAIRVTASIGVAVSHGTAGMDELIKAADTAMYQAKERGRNRIEVISL